jgi:hypothetical protein
MENQTEVVKKPFYKRKWFLITVGIIVVINLLPKNNSEKNNNLKINDIVEDNHKQKISTQKDTISLFEMKDELYQIMEKVKNINDDDFEYLKKEQIDEILNSFSKWNDILKLYGDSKDKEIITISKKLKNEILKKQIKYFPLMRVRYSKYEEDEWNDTHPYFRYYINVTTSEKDNSTITFIGGPLYNKDTVSKLHSKVNDMLIKLRFKKSEYKSDKGNIGLSFTIKSLSDNEM